MCAATDVALRALTLLLRTRVVRTSIFALSLCLAACGGDAEPPPPDCGTPVGSLDCARTLADAPAVQGWGTGGGARPVVVYFDRSGSMRGFLDPGFPARVATDYRSVIDRLVVGLRPAEAFGFGSAVSPVAATLGVLGNPEFYRDSNTEMEDALALIARDTLPLRTHVIVGDGRRGNPNAANSQYTAMRDAAVRWVERGGTFIVGASKAPFAPVADDASGCRANGAGATCPLYAFAFVARGDEPRIAGALTDVFEHLFVWPLPGVAGAQLSARAEAAGAAIQLHPTWATAGDGTRIVRSGGPAASTTPLVIRFQAGDSASVAGRTMHAGLAGQRLRPLLWARSLSLPAHAWSPLAAAGSLVRPSAEEPFAVRLFTRGSAAPAVLYRIDLTPVGEPSWLGEFAADSAGDAHRTFGIERLFEAFRHQAAQSEPRVVARMYVVAN